ncbi:MAG: dipicolinate synthase subunit B [Clostridia bacterium]|nr:dipicolinate synthase subunit B [Clostridia bacterium]
MKGKKIGYAMCGSFCTFSRALDAIAALRAAGAEIVPIMSDAAYGTDTRFGTSLYFRSAIRQMTGREIVHTITEAEPLGPAEPLDALVIAPCTGNTLAKLANGITDTAVTLAAKAHLRNLRPVIIGVSTNDALGAAAQNIGKLLSRRRIYFVPMAQDIELGESIQFNLLSPWVQIGCMAHIVGCKFIKS